MLRIRNERANHPSLAWRSETPGCLGGMDWSRQSMNTVMIAGLSAGRGHGKVDNGREVARI